MKKPKGKYKISNPLSHETTNLSLKPKDLEMIDNQSISSINSNQINLPNKLTSLCSFNKRSLKKKLQLKRSRSRDFCSVTSYVQNRSQSNNNNPNTNPSTNFQFSDFQVGNRTTSEQQFCSPATIRTISTNVENSSSLASTSISPANRHKLSLKNVSPRNSPILLQNSQNNLRTRSFDLLQESRNLRLKDVDTISTTMSGSTSIKNDDPNKNVYYQPQNGSILQVAKRKSVVFDTESLRRERNINNNNNNQNHSTGSTLTLASTSTGTTIAGSRILRSGFWSVCIASEL